MRLSLILIAIVLAFIPTITAALFFEPIFGWPDMTVATSAEEPTGTFEGLLRMCPYTDEASFEVLTLADGFPDGGNDPVDPGMPINYVTVAHNLSNQPAYKVEINHVLVSGLESAYNWRPGNHPTSFYGSVYSVDPCGTSGSKFMMIGKDKVKSDAVCGDIVRVDAEVSVGGRGQVVASYSWERPVRCPPDIRAEPIEPIEPIEFPEYPPGMVSVIPTPPVLATKPANTPLVIENFWTVGTPTPAPAVSVIPTPPVAATSISTPIYRINPTIIPLNPGMGPLNPRFQLLATPTPTPFSLR